MIEENKIVEEWYPADIFHTKIKEFINHVSSVMDIGCGIRPQQYIVPELLVCIEPYYEYVEILRKNLAGTNSIIIPFDAKIALATFPNKSIDSIFLIDVIEHMPKEIGEEILIECERVARKQIIIFTPLGFMPQEVHDTDGWNLHGGEWQEHKSGWHPKDFLGWDIIGCKELHTHDAKGENLATPYGGFYAIKNIVHTENYFNDVYAEKILTDSTNNLEYFKTISPNFINQIIHSEVLKNTLKCALWSCQRTTILLMDKKKDETVSEILKIVDNEKIDIFIKETKEYISKINKFALHFTDINNLQGQVNILQELLKNTTDELIVSSEKIIELENKIIELEKEINKSFLLKLYNKIKRILNRIRTI